MLTLRNRNSFPLAIPFVNRYANINSPRLSGAILREIEEILNHTNSSLTDRNINNWKTEDTDEAKVFSVALPGVNPERISVETSGGYLNIRVESESSEEDTKNANDNSMLYRFKIDDSVDTESITAKAELGILRIVVPKPDYGISKTIPIEVAA